jgi:hypothetical protein
MSGVAWTPNSGPALTAPSHRPEPSFADLIAQALGASYPVEVICKEQFHIRTLERRRWRAPRVSTATVTCSRPHNHPGKHQGRVAGYTVRVTGNVTDHSEAVLEVQW